MSTFGDETNDYLQRIAYALESVAASLEKIANPPMLVNGSQPLQPGSPDEFFAQHVGHRIDKFTKAVPGALGVYRCMVCGDTWEPRGQRETKASA